MKSPASCVVLVGPPGAGKSTVGALLAAAMNWAFLDTDILIEQQEQRTVADIFIEDGEAHFRELEVSAVSQALSRQRAVISLGGGAVLDMRTQQSLAGLPVVWLQVSVDVAVRRVGMQAARPLLLGNVRSRFVTLLAERAAIYAAVSTIAVSTDELPPEAIAEQIRTWLEQQGNL